jgi:hypothetical protein
MSNCEGSGVNNEITEARMAGIPVFLSVESLEKWRVQNERN